MPKRLQQQQPGSLLRWMIRLKRAAGKKRAAGRDRRSSPRLRRSMESRVIHFDSEKHVDCRADRDRAALEHVRASTWARAPASRTKPRRQTPLACLRSFPHDAGSTGTHPPSTEPGVRRCALAAVSCALHLTLAPGAAPGPDELYSAYDTFWHQHCRSLRQLAPPPG